MGIDCHGRAQTIQHKLDALTSSSCNVLPGHIWPANYVCRMCKGKGNQELQTFAVLPNTEEEEEAENTMKGTEERTLYHPKCTFVSELETFPLYTAR
ncbi:unnamed protein product [Prunus armeniaca]|uniref:Uncharacterized protein n=1 Tax=Prunus armeniaca TaxID=36596 RepID=A0A6J5TPH0_PRUAR|nr:unnamed protein product [Prunus armeniaca]